MLETDVFTTAVWSLSVSEVNSVAEERIPRLSKKEYSIMFSTLLLVEKYMQKVVTMIVHRLFQLRQ